MDGRDPHSALKTEVVATANHGSLEAVLARLQWGKDSIGYSLHVNPSSFTTSGIQRTDFLAYLGFGRSDVCSFTSSRQCFVKWVTEGFSPENFLIAFDRAFSRLERAENALNACGFRLPQPEGWGYFSGRRGGRPHRGPTPLYGDGHTALVTRSMKQTEDDSFFFRFSFIETDREKGFVTHYRPKHPPLSSELQSVLQYLELKEFTECPEFDFDACFYRTLAFESRGDGFFDRNTEYAHQCFDAHAEQFSPAIQELLATNAEIEALGISFLPFPRAADRLNDDIERRIIRPQKSAANTIATKRTTPGGIPSNFDVAISVAGPDKQHAIELANRVKAAGFAVFYYEFYPEYLWGKNQVTTFDEIFRKRSRFCVIFVSKEYRERVWTSHELRSAQARAVEEKGNEYILPIRIDNTELEGLLPTIAYLPISMGIDKIGELLIKKLQS